MNNSTITVLINILEFIISFKTPFKFMLFLILTKNNL